MQTFCAIDRELPRQLRELALSTASVGSPVGILLANVSGLLIQWCLWRALAIEVDEGGSGGECPFPVTAGDFNHTQTALP